ncbi:iron-containing redox enzyme family protein [Pseudomonas sp. CCC3.2]|uniref:iron-containing redox enzyme family protein n=1 Tax=unclassified Pseudomonas TaxID=196821 RepID=UPI002AB5065C|nr:MULTISPECIES: iron-containing redox enzyme family protein [unclassified Pseudomonas]MDY7560865.1 iron-containing redox enzyme family protein [Pseudomonas sp. AB6]MEA9976467.1 iron-containing redox enzyme family protein [Pseudomonas sp. RTS4]MEB0180886.1 iron-containing redox enzyme family protein [Pseudomonas sp. CCC3.2]MEB0198305.1 iron-containing redox enzyme family protein [Pseudomonas sp. 5S4]MEB0212816.1 iron-containing redox enzyme family protein [Pseudomonas sp. AB6]
MQTPGGEVISDAREFLHRQLALVGEQPCDLPENPSTLETWVESKASQVGELYARYLKARQNGGNRRYFTNKAHALYFLQCVAPSKAVDGAWLYGVLRHWDDYRFDGLVRTYLEELGDGDPAQNHVVLYRKLLAEHGCEASIDLQNQHYLQGALQLALGYNVRHFLPEVIGFNLGYEQLPLHLLITAYELSELGIDPYYFTLHVTIDNASSGHARRAAHSVLELMPVDSSPADFYRRVALGYRLNNLGLDTLSVIESFDLEHEVIQVLERKRSFGQHMHSDYCKFEGQTVNQWLQVPGKIPEFLAALQNKGWIKRDQDPELSRFWQLIDGPGASMFGVFSPYEKQLLRDWIAGSWCPAQTQSRARVLPGRARSGFNPSEASPPHQMSTSLPDKTVDADMDRLRTELQRVSQRHQILYLIERMAPGRHSTPAGLLATRLFAEFIGQ